MIAVMVHDGRAFRGTAIDRLQARIEAERCAQEAIYRDACDWPDDYDDRDPWPVWNFRIPDTDSDRLWIVYTASGLPVHLSANLESATAAHLAEQAKAGPVAGGARLELIAPEE